MEPPQAVWKGGGLVASQQWHQVLVRQAAAVESTIRTGPVTPKRFF